MADRSRLRVQGPAKSRRVVSVVLCLLLGSGIVWAVNHYRVVANIHLAWQEFRESLSREQPSRGTIYDRNLKQLAVTLDRVSVYARTREVENIDATVQNLEEIVPMDKERVQEQLESGTLRVWLATDINEEQEAEIKKRNISGVYLQREEHRFYPNGSRAAHIIGYAEGGIGLAGAELYYDHLLAERKLAMEHADRPVVDSQDLVLTLDLKIQEIVEEILGDVASVGDVSQAMAYLLENGTGELVAAAHIPTFDPNNFTQVAPEILNDRFLEVLPVPSVFQTFFTQLSGLYVANDGVALPWSLVPQAGDESIQKRFLELVGVRENASVDLFGSKGEAVAEEPVFKPVIVARGENGVAPEQMSPMALLDAMGTVLSADVTRPAVVKRIIDAGSGEESILSGEQTLVPLSSDQNMIAVIEQAAPLLKSTAVVGDSGAYYVHDKILTVTGSKWNTAFARFEYIFAEIPAGEHNLSMLIVLQRPTEGPNRKHDVDLIEKIEPKIPRIIILQQVSRTIADVLEPENLDTENFQEKKVLVNNGEELQKGASSKPAVLGIMPDLTGMSLRKSLRLIQGMPLEISIQGSGRVVSQKPLPGTPIKKTTICLLVLEQGASVTP